MVYTIHRFFSNYLNRLCSLHFLAPLTLVNVTQLSVTGFGVYELSSDGGETRRANNLGHSKGPFKNF